MYRYKLTRKGILLVVIMVIIFGCTSIIATGRIIKASQLKKDDSERTIRTKLVTSYASDSNSNTNSDENTKANNSGKNDNLENINAINTVDTLSIKAENIYVNDGKKIAFLTFDDGPSKRVTPKILKVLDHYHIKATFFVVGSNIESNRLIVQNIENNGHAIGIHTYTHKYKKVYSNLSNFRNEIFQTDQMLKDVLGQNFETRLFRFPGGSFEKYKNPYKKELEKLGYVYTDWNVINGDGESSKYSTQKQLDTIKRTIRDEDRIVILMHDSSSKENTARALPQIIEFLQERGYEFGVIK